MRVTEGHWPSRVGGGACGAVRQGAQAGDAAADHRDGRPPVQARRHRRLGGRHAHGGRGTDQRRLLRPLRNPRKTSSPPRSPTSSANSARACARWRPAAPESSSSCARTFRVSTATTPTTAARPPPCSTRSGAARTPTKQAYTDGVLAVIDDIAARLAPDDPQSARVKTLSVFAMMVGTLQLSRALADRQLADDGPRAGHPERPHALRRHTTELTRGRHHPGSDLAGVEGTPKARNLTGQPFTTAVLVVHFSLIQRCRCVDSLAPPSRTGAPPR